MILTIAILLLSFIKIRSYADIYCDRVTGLSYTTTTDVTILGNTYLLAYANSISTEVALHKYPLVGTISVVDTGTEVSKVIFSSFNSRISTDCITARGVSVTYSVVFTNIGVGSCSDYMQFDNRDRVYLGRLLLVSVPNCPAANGEVRVVNDQQNPLPVQVGGLAPGLPALPIGLPDGIPSLPVSLSGSIVNMNAKPISMAFTNLLNHYSIVYRNGSIVFCNASIPNTPCVDTLSSLVALYFNMCTMLPDNFVNIPYTLKPGLGKNIYISGRKIFLTNQTVEDCAFDISIGNNSQFVATARINNQSNLDDITIGVLWFTSIPGYYTGNEFLFG